ncbi:nuclear transport factor 2 family protein [Actinomadura sp. ATCC 31491]|uniref:Nuclear transport factor 2 family protein n=1 Tax=Actinomadura luzonensis TaxID=2805427 RepID=A0ABT0FJ54_9ACTN|nr:nuclear transport factor 2 family protein [Actinomadura luzonensis]MCK2212327.1 nuclear transport factor 2 family protein [Actinomadura luzonensis]
MRTVPELLAANLHDVFGNRDAAARRAAIDEIYAEDVVFTDPEGVTRGRDALEEKARRLLDRVPPEFVFAEDGPRYASAGRGALAWAFGPEGAPAVRGLDVISVTDGRIAEIVTLFAAT